ncbi:hypothetical protein ACWGIB_21705 [Streptomyces xiamenensis]
MTAADRVPALRDLSPLTENTPGQAPGSATAVLATPTPVAMIVIAYAAFEVGRMVCGTTEPVIQ